MNLQMEENETSCCQKCSSKNELDRYDTPYTWCKDCYYFGIDDDYNEYQYLLEEGHRRIDAAVMSGWQGAEEFVESE